MSNWVSRNQGHIITLLLALLVNGGLILVLHWPRGEEPIEIITPAAPSAIVTPSQTTLRIYVSGAVRQADVYRLPAGSIVKDAVNAAGGLAEQADSSRINLAQELQDQMQVHIPLKGEMASLAGQADNGAGRQGTGQLLDINTATAAQLDTLPGIGPTLGRQIVDYRQAHGNFKSIDELTNVPGIGEAKLNQIRELIMTSR
jgi:competence protein ComEA